MIAFHRALQLGAALCMAALLSACGTPMGLTKETSQLDLSKKSMVLATFEVTRSNGRLMLDPGRVWLRAPQSADGKGVTSLSIDDEGLEQDTGKPRKLVMLRMALEPGKHNINGVLGSISGILTRGTWFVPTEMDFEVPAQSVVYLGRISAHLRERKDNEFRAGPVIPLIDQAVLGISNATFDVTVSDQSAVDLPRFKESYAVLRDQPIQSRILPAYDRGVFDRQFMGRKAGTLRLSGKSRLSGRSRIEAHRIRLAAGAHNARLSSLRAPALLNTMGNRLTQIATRTGDDGTTGLGDNTRVPKHHLRIAAMGDVDELNSHIGLLLCEPLPDAVRELLVDVQHQLFNLGGELSMPGYTLLKDEALAQLDAALAEHNAALPRLMEFILPAGTRGASQAHVCRTIARRAERAVVALGAAEAVNDAPRRYLNRLSDLLFVLARVLNRMDGGDDVYWKSERLARAQQEGAED